MRLTNTYRPLKRISPLVWIEAGRPLDEKEISAVTLPVTIRAKGERAWKRQYIERPYP
jgi:hypothetical protein